VTFIKLRLSDEEANCTKSDYLPFAGVKLCIQCNEYRNGLCVASYLPSKVGKQQHKRKIYYTCHTAFIIHAISNFKDQVVLYPLYPDNPTDSDAKQHPRAWCTERMNVIFLATLSKQPIAKGNDVHANWRDYFIEKGTFNGLSGFDQAVSETKQKAITIMYKELFLTFQQQIAKMIARWVTDNPVALSTFTGNNNKITDDIKHIIPNALPESFCPNISKKILNILSTFVLSSHMAVLRWAKTF
jgi:hypothetical protein